MKTKLTYSEGREVEKLVRRVWERNGYQTGHNDGTVAASASARLNQPVSAVNVRYIREQIGYVLKTERATACVGSLLSITELRRIEELLRDRQRVVITPHTSRASNRISVMSLETYMSHRDRMARIKPWLAQGAGRKGSTMAEASSA